MEINPVWKFFLLCTITTVAGSLPPPSNNKEILDPKKVEAEFIVLDSESTLLPEPSKVDKVLKAIQLIRAQHPILGNITQKERWKLGKVSIKNFDDKIKKKISNSKYGPITNVQPLENKSVAVSFSKRYNPNVLVGSLSSELQIQAGEIWNTDSHDFGAINYNPEEPNKYTFRQGLTNCGPDCKINRYWDMKFDEKTNKSTILSEYGSGV